MKFGIIGAGGIAATMAETLQGMPQVERTAIGARDLERAKAFAAAWGFRKAYGSYDALFEDPEVELVYIAVPHSHHYQYVMAALEAGKHVLCEKAFAANAAQAREMSARARDKGLLRAEALWTRYMPSRQIIDGIIAAGEIGQVRTVTANLGYAIDTKERIIRPELAGGALLDLTVYPLNFASMVLGNDIASMDAVCTLTDTGVDGQDVVTLRYRDGSVASLFTSIYTLTDRRGMIYGTKGFIEVQNINNPERIFVYSDDKEAGMVPVRTIEVPAQITGYEYEVEACIRALEQGAVECPEMPHSETLELMEQMDRIRARFGVRFPFE